MRVKVSFPSAFSWQVIRVAKTETSLELSVQDSFKRKVQAEKTRDRLNARDAGIYPSETTTLTVAFRLARNGEVIL